MATTNLTAELTLTSGATQDVTATAAWTSSDPEVATVAAGVVTAVAVGEATITATVGDLFDTSAITVVDTPVDLLVTPSEDEVEVS